MFYGIRRIVLLDLGKKIMPIFRLQKALQTSSLTHFFINLNVFCITYMSTWVENPKIPNINQLEIVSLREPEFWRVWILSPKKEDGENQ